MMIASTEDPEIALKVMSQPYLGIVNVMVAREVVKELLQEKATGERIAAELERLLTSPEARSALLSELAAVVAQLGSGGSHRRAAEAVAAAWEGEA